MPPITHSRSAAAAADPPRCMTTPPPHPTQFSHILEREEPDLALPEFRFSCSEGLYHTPLGGRDPPPHFPQFSADRMSNPFCCDSPVPVQSPCSQRRLAMLRTEVEDSEWHMAAIHSEVELLNKCIANLMIGSDGHRSSASTPSAQGDGAPLIDIAVVPEFIGDRKSTRL